MVEKGNLDFNLEVTMATPINSIKSENFSIVPKIEKNKASVQLDKSQKITEKGKISQFHNFFLCFYF